MRNRPQQSFDIDFLGAMFPSGSREDRENSLVFRLGSTRPKEEKE